MTYRIGVKTTKDRNWVHNDLVFNTKEEADAYRIDLFSRWTALVDAKVFDWAAPANARWVDGQLQILDDPDIHITPEDEGYGI